MDIDLVSKVCRWLIKEVTMSAKRIKKVIKGLKKASKTHAAQAKTLKSVLRKRRKKWAN